MNWNDYEAIWKRQTLPVGPSADVGELKDTFESKSRKLAASIQVRDFAEASAGVVVAAAYVFHWSQLGTAGWPLALSITLILGVTGFFVRERFRARGLRLGADASLLAKIEADIAELQHQCRLLRTVWAWYLAPCGGAIAIHFHVIVAQTPPGNPLHEPLVGAGFAAFFAFFLWLVWELNRRALRKQFEPRLAELERLRREMIASS